MKIFKFRRFVQRKLLLSPPRPTATPHPLFVRHSASYPRPNYIHPLPPYLPFRAVYSASGYSNAVTIISFRLGFTRASSSGGEPLSLFFLLAMPGRGNCLLSFEIVALPSSLLLPHLVINFAESVCPYPSENQVLRRVSLLASSFDENA